MSLSAVLLTYWTGGDDRTIQGNAWFKSTSHDPSDYNEGSDGWSDDRSEDSLRSLYRTREIPTSKGSEQNLPREESAEHIEESNISEPIEITGVQSVPVLEEVISYSSLRKKSRK
jgi:hypothetical protein